MVELVDGRSAEKSVTCITTPSTTGPIPCVQMQKIDKERTSGGEGQMGVNERESERLDGTNVRTGGKM